MDVSAMTLKFEDMQPITGSEMLQMFKDAQAKDLPAHLTASDTEMLGINVRVFLDGVEAKHVVEANTEDGWLVRVKLNERGEMFADENDDVATDRLDGVVTVETI